MTTIQLELPIPEALPNELFTTALEGGIGYWSVCVSQYHWSNPDGTEDLTGFNVTVELTDEEDPEEFIINRDVIELGIKRILEGGITVNDTIRESLFIAVVDYENRDCDAEVADCVVQAGLFNEIVYG
ncbi:MAG: hypothetical protein KGI54_13170 [Pseudomonadota bacterium]|nr:hypothetical protein [Pseudomonadota bacterium]